MSDDLPSLIIEDIIYDRNEEPLLVGAEINLYITGVIDDRVLLNIISKIKQLDVQHEEYDQVDKSKTILNVYIDSGGGNLPATLSIISTLLNSGYTIKTYGLGVVSSAGFFLFLAGKERYCYPHTLFLHHKSYYPWLEGHLDEDTLKIRTKILSKSWDIILDYLKKRLSKKSCSYLEEQRAKDKDFEFLGDEAQELGIATDLITNDA